VSNSLGYNIEWDFGDGTSGPEETEENPTHTYTSDGNYDVSVTVEDDYGCISVVDSINYVHIQPVLPAFTLYNSSYEEITEGVICIGEQTYFFCDNEGYGASWNFDGGNPTTSNQVSAEVVFNTADFLASIAHYDSIEQKYVLGPPLIPVSENIDFMSTFNPTFELGYWRFGLKTALNWYNRLRKEPPEILEKVLKNLAPLPVEDGLYVMHEGIQNMWTKYNYEHPALIGAYGMLPGDGVDIKILENTFDKILTVWNFNRVWGWDFPMLAMTAVRLNRPDDAINLLLHDNFIFDQHGLSYGEGSPYPYFPSNGGLLTAIALMTGGWDNADNVHAPGFPKNGMWKVKSEGFKKMP